MLFRAYVLALMALFAAPWIVPTSANSSTYREYSTRPSLPMMPEKPVRPIPTDYSRTKQLSPMQLKQVLTSAGFEGENLRTAWAIAMRESSGRPRAHNGNAKTGDNSYGLFQINMMEDLGTSRRAKYELVRNEDLFHPHTNAEIAYHMSRRGTDFGAWAIGANSYREDKSHELRKWLVSYPR